LARQGLGDIAAGAADRFRDLGEWVRWDRLRQGGWWARLGMLLAIVVILLLAIGWYWSQEPDRFSVTENARAYAEGDGELATGYVTTAAAVRVADTLLEKPGGYISNDLMPPGVYLDNIANWEYGALVQLRDLTRALRNDISRSQSQSVEDRDLVIAEPQFNFDSESWAFPTTEGEYREGMEALSSYMRRLNDENEADAQFYARADNLVAWLAIVETRLGSLSQRLSASVGRMRLNVDLAGESGAAQSTPRAGELHIKTPWLELDDVFYEARGATWALLHFLRAVEADFEGILANKNARVSLRQIIRELEGAQQSVWSPVVLNGSGFGLLANHSLVMASYVSRANAALIDLKSLLERG